MTEKRTPVFIVTPKADMKLFVHQHDRDFFSVPVEVVPHSSDVRTKTLYVQSPLQGDVIYPVNPAILKHEWGLTRRQLKASRRIEDVL